MNRSILTLGLLFVSIITACSAFAMTDYRPQNREGGALIFSPFAGYYIFQPGQRYGVDAPNYDLENTYSLGLRLGYEIDNHFDIEATLNYVPAEHNLGDVSVYLYHADLLYNIMNYDRFTPYLDLGLGGTRFSPFAGFTNDYFQITYAAGLKIFIIENLAFRLEFRGYTKFAETFTNLNITGGLTYYIGLSKQKVTDSDKDGVTDIYDLCPTQPETYNGYMDNDGCPEDKALEDPLQKTCIGEAAKEENK